MARHTIEIQETFDVPRSRVFALFADHQRFGRLLGARSGASATACRRTPNGIGSVRKIGLGPIGLEETVLNFEPDTLIEYSISSLSPIRNHHGRIRFADTPDGRTHLHYTITFEDRIPGDRQTAGAGAGAGHPPGYPEGAGDGLKPVPATNRYVGTPGKLIWRKSRFWPIL